MPTTSPSRLALSIDCTVGDFSLHACLEIGAETVALVGPNGSGKSTLLLAILGIRESQQGRITLGDEVLFDSEQRISLPTEERHLAYLPQDFGLFPFLSAQDNVAFALACRGEKQSRTARRKAALEYLDRLAIAHLATRRPDQLSGGQRQRVALARALASQPHAMLLDEPTAALDVGARDEIRALIRNSIRDLNIPALIVTHDFGDVTTMATHVAAMDAGQLVACVNVAEVQAAPPTAFVARLAQPAGIQSSSSLENPPAPIFQSSRRSL